MRIFVSSMSHESNTFNDQQTPLEAFEILRGQDLINRLSVCKWLIEQGCEVLPGAYAYASSSGTVAREAYQSIKETMMAPLREAGAVDGVWLFLHGAMFVEGIGSGDHDLLREIRACVGDRVPISVAMDSHGNITEDFLSMLNAVCCFRTAPHTDSEETRMKAARMLMRLIKAKTLPRPAYHRVPILLGGERCLSAEEPYRTINRRLEELEASPSILSACYHVGYAWADHPHCCAGVSVVPADPGFEQEAREKAEAVGQDILARRKDFGFAVEALDPAQAIEKACASGKRPFFVSDSGDNITAGAKGCLTDLLRLFLDSGNQEKRVLFAPIVDADAAQSCTRREIGEEIEIAVGAELRRGGAKTTLRGVLKAKGGYVAHGNRIVGNIATLALRNGIDVMIGDRNWELSAPHLFEAANVSLEDYDIIVIKLGYLFAKLAEIAAESVLALTEGDTCQLTENLPYQRILRPMYPVDEL